VTWRWPWRRWHRDGRAAAEARKAVDARQAAQRRLDEVEQRWDEVRTAGNLFAAQVEAALAHRRPP